VRPESGDTTGVVTSTGVGECGWSREVRPESGYTTGIISSDRSRAYDRSCAYDRNRDIPAL
jgi:hypothetical protein